MSRWIVQMTVYLPGCLSVRAKLRPLEANGEWNFLTPFGPLRSFTSCTSPGYFGQRQMTLVPFATLTASGAKKLSPILMTFDLAPPALLAGTRANRPSARVAAAIFLLKLDSFRRW